MPEKPPTNSDPYYLDPSFERAVVAICSMRPNFWGRIGHALDPDCLSLEPAKRIVRACRQIALETHRGPESPMIVLQQMRRWLDEGKADGALPKIKECAVLLDDAFEAGMPSDDAAVAALKPTLARRLRDEAVEQAIEERGKDGTFANVVRLIDRANRLGDTNTSVGVRLGSASFAEIEKLKLIERHGTGIWELDNILEGGMRRGCLGLLVGSSGDGKSMGLSHIAAYSIRCGLFTVYATLEVPPADVLARLKGNLTGMPINAILADPRRIEPVLAGMPLAPFIVQEFTPQATTMQDIEAWVTKCEEEVGLAVDVLITDYGDKLIAPSTGKKGEAESGYTQGRVVFERMRIYANEGHARGKIWHWSASQAKRQEKAKGKGVHQMMDLNDTADSLHKIRVADLVVTINTLENGIKWFVAKNRHGKSRVSTDALPADFECGRVSPVMLDGGVSMPGDMDLA